jgi:hypothetical protein
VGRGTRPTRNGLEFKTQLAEEIRDGRWRVALRDIQRVQFSGELSGEMIVIERYLVTPEWSPN